MKKVLVSVLLTVGIMSLGCIGYVNHIVNNYETKLEDSEFYYDALDKNYNQKVNDYKTIKTEHEDLQEQVWNILNDGDYNVTIKHEDQYHTYTKEKENMFFSKKSHTVVG